MSVHSEEMLRHVVHGHEPLHVGGRLEAPHLALALSGRLVGDFGAIVRVLVGAVNHRRHHGAVRRRVAAQLVGDQRRGSRPWFFNSLRRTAPPLGDCVGTGRGCR